MTKLPRGAEGRSYEPKLKKSLWKAGDIVRQRNHRDDWKRYVIRVIHNYGGREGAIGYEYRDDFGYMGMCSEQTLQRWKDKNHG